MNGNSAVPQAAGELVYGYGNRVAYDVDSSAGARLDLRVNENFLKIATTMAVMSLVVVCSILTAHAADQKDTRPSTSIGTAHSPAISHAWARATVPGQAVGAAYMKIYSAVDTTLTGIESDVSRSVEVHSMRHQNGVMQMRAQKQLEVPAGQGVDLAPGCIHLMLLGLKKPLKAGESLQLKMTFVDGAGNRTIVPVRVPIRPFGQ